MFLEVCPENDGWLCLRLRVYVWEQSSVVSQGEVRVYVWEQSSVVSQGEVRVYVWEQSSVVSQGEVRVYVWEQGSNSVPLSLCSVMIVDWDIHHGNATQHMFYNDKRYSTSVLFRTYVRRVRGNPIRL